jgi:Flp pilus assembly protein TadD
MQNYTQALEDYSEAIRFDPTNSVYYNNRGNIYSKIENTNQASIDFNKAIEIKTKEADTYK